MAWTITRERDFDQERMLPCPAFGEGETDGRPSYPFRIRDDDGIVYASGRYDESAALDDESDDGLYAALTFYGRVLGATDLQVKVRDGLAFGLTSPGIVSDRNLSPDDWVSVYA